MIKSTLPELINRVQTAEKSRSLRLGLQLAQIVVGEIRLSIRTWVSRTEGPKTGALMRSFRPVVEETSKGLMAGVYSDLIYARIHEYGGPIVPKNAKALAIPLTNTARRVAPRSFPGGLFVWKSPRTQKAFLRSRDDRSFQYVLKDRVDIRPKGYLKIAADTARPKIVKHAERWLKEFGRAG